MSETFEKTQLEIGDVVQLKSGGPKMTVVAIDGRLIETCWFDETGRVESSGFHRNCLFRILMTIAVQA